MFPSFPYKATFDKISDILKHVDTLVKAEDLDRARAEILLAKELNPRNMYCQAYLERVDSLLEQRKRNNEAAHAKKLAEDTGRMSKEQQRQKQTEDEERLRVLQQGEAERLRREEQRRHAGEIVSYNRALFEAWESGTPSAAAELTLASLRRSLRISPQEHKEGELGIRRECYIQAFRNLWTRQSFDDPATITELRQRYNISGDEFEVIEVELLQTLKKPPAGPTVLVIDDDEGMLTAIATVLLDEHFDVRTFTTSDEAYQFLLHSTPAIILADINLETSSYGGFAFFEKVQQIPRLSRIPFVFVSGLSDEIVIRAGKEIGADDYIAKPFDQAHLVAVVKGKLRRYDELRRVSVH